MGVVFRTFLLQLNCRRNAILIWVLKLYFEKLTEFQNFRLLFEKRLIFNLKKNGSSSTSWKHRTVSVLLALNKFRCLPSLFSCEHYHRGLPYLLVFSLAFVVAKVIAFFSFNHLLEMANPHILLHFPSNIAVHLM